MKKLKKVLIIAGIMTSLSFVNCFAAQNEKKIDILEEDENNSLFTLNYDVQQINALHDSLEGLENLPIILRMDAFISNPLENNSDEILNNMVEFYQND